VTDSMAELERVVADLLDRQQILDCLTRYARGVDRLDRELLLSAFHSDAIDDHGKFVGGPDEFADWALSMHRETHLAHQHCLLNHSCELSGTTAHTETYFMFVAMNRVGPAWSMSGGRYIDRFERRDGTWAIAARVCIREWALVDERPNPGDLSAFTATSHLLTPALRQFMNDGPSPRRDRSDPSYRRPLRADEERLSAWQQLPEAGGDA